VIVGVGVDIVEVNRIAVSLERFGSRFLKKILVDAEQRPELSGRRLAAYVAKQFAAKEAVSKALGTGMGAGVSFAVIGILRNRHGMPYVELKGRASDHAMRIGADRIQVSLSDEREYALAYAIASSDE